MTQKLKAIQILQDKIEHYQSSTVSYWERGSRTGPGSPTYSSSIGSSVIVKNTGQWRILYCSAVEHLLNFWNVLWAYLQKKYIHCDCNIIVIPSKKFIKHSISNGRSFYFIFFNEHLRNWRFLPPLICKLLQINWEKSRRGLNSQLYTLHRQPTNFLFFLKQMMSHTEMCFDIENNAVKL